MSFTDNNNDDYHAAAQWLDLFSEAKVDDLTAQRFKKWLEGSRERKAIFDRMLTTWQDPALTVAIRDSYQRSDYQPRRWGNKRVWPRIGVAGVLVVCCVACAVWLPWLSNSGAPSVQSWQVATTVAQQQDQNLADGSQIEASAQTRVLVEYSAHVRKILLAQGAANFKVAKDKQRPFEVTVDNAKVIAVGTEFNVDKTVDGTDVTVFEGAVEVVTGEATTLLSAGEKIRIVGSTFTPIKRFDLKRIIDWRSGWIELDDESLRYLVEQLNRQSDTPIDIAEDTLGNKRIAGRFRLKDTEQILAMLSKVHDFQVIHEKHKIILKNTSGMNRGV